MADSRAAQEVATGMAMALRDTLALTTGPAIVDAAALSQRPGPVDVATVNSLYVASVSTATGLLSGLSEGWAAFNTGIGAGFILPATLAQAAMDDASLRSAMARASTYYDDNNTQALQAEVTNIGDGILALLADVGAILTLFPPTAEIGVPILIGVATAKALLDTGALNYASAAIGSLFAGARSALGGLFGDGIDLHGINNARAAALGLFESAKKRLDPIVLDLSGEGVSLSGLSSLSTSFDFDGDGLANLTGWVKSGTGLLAVVTENGVGSTDWHLVNSFADLAAQDGNGDGVIDASDAIFSKLRVWQDINADGIVDPGEMLSLDQLGIVSIGLSTTSSSVSVNGNLITATGTFQYADGRNNAIAAVSLDASPTYTTPTNLPAISPDIALLPQMSGSGRMFDLHSAMVRDQGLKNLVSGLQAALTNGLSAFSDQVKAVMFQWAGVSGLYGFRGGVDVQRLGFLEAYFGEAYEGLGGSSPNYHASPDLELAWNNIFDATLARLLFQTTGGGSLLPEFTYNAQTDVVLPVNSDLGAALKSLTTRLGQPTAANLQEWLFALRVVDSVRLELGLSVDSFAGIYSAFTSDSVIALGAAVASNSAITVLPTGIAITGSSVADSLYAGPGISRLDGVRGGQTYDDLDGGHDTFYYRLGDGSVVISDNDIFATNPSNTLIFGDGIAPAALIVSTSGSGITLTLPDGAVITLESMLDSPTSGVQFVRFADGTTWTRGMILALSRDVSGGEAYFGTTGDDRFDLGAGEKFVVGMGGNDTFVFDRGYGVLEIELGQRAPNDVGSQTLQFGQGVAPSDISLSATVRGDLKLSVIGTSDSILINELFKNVDQVGWSIKFANGVTWNIDDIVAAQLAGASTAGDVLYGSTKSEFFDGKGGQDKVIGGGGSDTFVYALGYGALEISETSTNADASVLLLGAGISINDLSVRITDMGDVIVALPDGGSIQIDGMYSSTSLGVRTIQFSDGSQLSRAQLLGLATTGSAGQDTLYGTAAADVFDGKGGGDLVYGGGGSDTFVFNAGYGALQISESYYNSDQPVLRLGPGIHPADVRVSATSDWSGVRLTDGIVGDEIYLQNLISGNQWGVARVEFYDGAVWTAADLIQMAHSILGTTGNDTLSGSVGNDRIDGRGGSDFVQGAGGNDTFVFDAGYGSLEIKNGFLSGQSPVLSLGSGVSAAAVKVTVGGANGHDLVITDGVSGDQVTLDGMDESGSGTGVSRVEFADGTVWSDSDLRRLAHTFTGTVGNDSITGTSGADFFDGKGGVDLIVGGGGEDTFAFSAGYGQLEISEYAGVGNASTAILKLGAGINASNLVVSSDASGNLYLVDDVTGDKVKIDGMMTQSEWGHNSYGIAQILFADGTVWDRQQIANLATSGTTGSDTLYGSPDAEVFDGNGGNDVAVGNGGADTFVFNAGYGQLEINEYAGIATASTATLRLGAGISASNVAVTADAVGNLYVTDGVSGDQVKIDAMMTQSAWGHNAYGIAEIQFADGTIWTRQQIVNMAMTGTTGDDTLRGSPNDEVFDGRGGNDLEIGNGGADTFVFNSGYGHLEIDENAGNLSPSSATLALGAGVNPANISVTSDAAGNVYITDGAAGDQIKIDGMMNHNASGYNAYGIAQIQFTDGTVWNRQQIFNAATTGTTGNDTLYGSPNADVFDGKGGNDVAVGNGGADTFMFNAGYGQLEINSFAGTFNTSTAVLALGAGINSSNISVTSDASGNLYITDGVAGDQIKIDGMMTQDGWGYNAYGIAQIQFADGTVWTREKILYQATTGTPGNDTLNGSPNADMFDGKGGNDVVVGNGGADTFVFNAGYGQLEINEYAGNFQASAGVLALGAGIDKSQVAISSDASGNMYVTDGVAGDRIKIDGMMTQNGWGYNTYGITQIQFADGSVWDRQTIVNMATTGTTGNDTLYGSPNGEVLDGKGGNDVMVGNGGADTFVFKSGYGRLEIDENAGNFNVSTATLALGAGISASNVTVSSDASGNLYITDGVTGDQVKIDNMLTQNGWGYNAYGVAQIQFTDGTVWSRQQIVQLATTGTSGNDTLNGTSSADYFDGKGGNDLEVGNGGADTFVFNAGYGQLEINEYAGLSNVSAATLALGAGISELSVAATSDASGNLYITDGITGDRIKIDGMLTQSAWGYNSYGVAQIQFADGTVWTRQQLANMAATGTTGNDTLYGSPNGEVFDGKGGNDLEVGNGGADTFVFNAGYGQLEINDYAGLSNASTATLVLGAGIDKSNIAVTSDAAGNLILTDGIAGDQVKIDGMMTQSAWGYNAYGVAQIQFADGTVWTRQQLANMATTGTTGNDTLYGSPNAEVFDGKGGNDTEIGNGGADTYVFNAGYGQLTVLTGLPYTYSAAGELLITGENPDQIWLQRTGNDLQVEIMGSTSQVTIQGWFNGPQRQVSDIALHGGTTGNWTMSNTQVDQLIQAMAAFSASNAGFDPTSAQNPRITDPTVLGVMSTSWHQ